MKEWEELEDNFLKEIQPLIDEFFEYKKSNIEDKQERERLYKIRRDIRKTVESKVKPFVEKYTKMVNEEIKRLEEEAKQIREWKKGEVESLKQLRDKVLKTDEAQKYAKDEEAYQLLSLSKAQYKHELEKRIQKCNEQIRKHNSDIQEAKKLKDMLEKEFKMKYGDIKSVSENDMEILRMDTYLQEEKSDPVMKDGIVYYESSKEMDTFGDFVDMQVNMQVAAYQKEIEDKQREQKEKKQQIEAKDRELIEIQKEIAQGVLNQKRQEFEEYLNEKMKELEESIDEELKEMQETNIRDDEDNNKKNNKGSPKKDKITLWQKFKSIFRKRNIPLLGEAKKQVTQYGNKFKKDIKLGVPTLIQQANNTKEIIGKNEEKSSEDEKIAEL